MKKSASFIIVNIIICVLISCSCDMRNSSMDYGGDFWNLIHASKTDIEEIYIVYHEQPIKLNHDMSDEILNRLDLSKKIEVNDNHVFKQSDFQLLFKTKEKDLILKFTWFNGKRLLEGSLFEYSDNRFDLEWNDTIFHFSLSSHNLLNDEIIYDMYKKSASMQEKKTIQELLGYDFMRFEPDYAPTEYGEVNISNLLENSNTNIVAILKYIGTGNDVSNPRSDNMKYDCFKVEETIYGDININDKIVLENMSGFQFDSYHNNYIYWIPSFIHPTYETGKLYVAFLSKAPLSDNEMVYLLTNGQYGIAVIDDGYLYPAYNTEDHPLYNMPLEDIYSMFDK